MHLLISVKGKESVFKTLTHYYNINSENYFFKTILIVDLHGDNNLKEFCRKNSIDYISHYKRIFNKSFALNIGINALHSKFPNDEVLICDADVIIERDHLSKLVNHNKNIILDFVEETKDGSTRKAFGIIKCSLLALVDVNGYDSFFKGWGFEDHDIIWRLESSGCQFERTGKGIHLSHEDIERVKHYYSNNLSKMRANNKKYFENKVVKKNLSGSLIEDISLIKYEATKTNTNYSL